MGSELSRIVANKEYIKSCKSINYQYGPCMIMLIYWSAAEQIWLHEGWQMNSQFLIAYWSAAPVLASRASYCWTQITCNMVYIDDLLKFLLIYKSVILWVYIVLSWSLLRHAPSQKWVYIVTSIFVFPSCKLITKLSPKQMTGIEQ